jgi:SAM-dependent methyltransferase
MGAFATAPTAPEPDLALAAYEVLAPFYDDFTAGYAHEPWLAKIDRLLQDFGVPGRRVLDVACGTGKSSLPLLERGYEVTACDLSPRMVEAARRRVCLPPERVFVADMRRLPRLPAFDAVTALDDAVNYLTTSGDVKAAFSAVRGVLRPGGLFVFDVNSLSTYLNSFTGESSRQCDGLVFHWRGKRPRSPEPGALFSATIEVIPPADRGQPATSRHVQRHYDVRALRTLLTEAGLQTLEVFGQSTGARLSTPADESRHSKLLFVAQRPDRGRRES